MNSRIEYEKWTFTADQIHSGDLHVATALTALSLEVNSFIAEVECGDPSIKDFKRNAILRYYPKRDRPMIFLVQNIRRTSPTRYEITSGSILGLLTEGRHYGGIYTGQTVQEVVGDICGGVPYIVKTSLRNIRLYGWLPIAAPRDNLAQVLFAIGATLKTDLDGVLRIEGLWDRISSQVPRDEMYMDAAVETESKVTQVIVTEHQYTPGQEEKLLFEGTADPANPITFDEPMHSLTASGFTVLASGANWARLSAGTGTLNGKPYIHNTRQIISAVQDADTPNIKSVSDATLVSLANSKACAKRLAEYYRRLERIDADVIYKGEAPGDVRDTWHPFDKTTVSACLESADIILSNTLKAREKLLVGYVPPQIGEGAGSNLNYREVLTGAGQWVPPEGVTDITYVMFSGAQGGYAGQKGGDAAASQSHSWTNKEPWGDQAVTGRGRIQLWGAGGKGGPGGLGGKGSKLLQGSMEVTPGAPISYNCGVGGVGSLSPDAPGAEGGETSFGSLTTASGTYPTDAGWQDPFTQEIFASTGVQGLPGGDGAGAIPNYTIPSDSNKLDEILRYQPSTGAYDEDGRYWAGAPTREKSSGVAWYSLPWADNTKAGMQAGYQLGPGGAAGVTQAEPSGQGAISLSNNTASAANGLTPPTPLPPRKRGLTLGGRGGYGGGGGSGPSWAGVEALNGVSFSVVPGAPGPGGSGGQGSQGGDGMIILYYTKVEDVQMVQFLDKNGKKFLDRHLRRFIT